MISSDLLSAEALETGFGEALKYHSSQSDNHVSRETGAQPLETEFFRNAQGGEIWSRLSLYAHEVLEGNQYASLVSRKDPVQQIHQNILDSLLLAPIWEAVSRETGTILLDAGTGSGVPGIPAQLLLQQRGFQFKQVLIESNEKKQYFLQKLIREMELENTLLFSGRLESERLPVYLETECPPRSRFFLTTRALAPISRTLHWVRHLRSQLECALFFKGPETSEKEGRESDRWRSHGWVLGEHRIFSSPQLETHLLKLLPCE